MKKPTKDEESKSENEPVKNEDSQPIGAAAWKSHEPVPAPAPEPAATAPPKPVVRDHHARKHDEPAKAETVVRDHHARKHDEPAKAEPKKSEA